MIVKKELRTFFKHGGLRKKYPLLRGQKRFPGVESAATGPPIIVRYPTQGIQDECVRLRCYAPSGGKNKGVSDNDNYFTYL